MTKIILIGYRGTGKSTVGQSLGKRLNVPVWDSDPEIERRAGKTITEMFNQDGEATFRDLEAAVIADLLQRDSFVLATGGGAVLREETRRRLRQSGQVVYLIAKPATILRRMQDDKKSATMRPGLTSLPPLEEILVVLEKRRSLYEETAHVTIDTSGKTVEEVVEDILSLINH